MPTDLPEAMTIREVATFLRVSRNTVYAEIRRGKLRCIHMHKRITRVLRGDLEAYLNSIASTKKPKP